MPLPKSLLDEAAARGLLHSDQVEPLWAFLAERTAAATPPVSTSAAPAAAQPSFRVTHILYYLGGLIAIGAMSLFMTLGWERFGGWGLLGIALAYGGGGLWLTERLLRRHGLPIPAGLTGAFVVVLVPLAIYGLQVGLGFWAEGRPYAEYHSHIDWRWLLMELGTLAAGAALLWRYRLPFLVMPVAVTLWYMGMDLAPFLLGDIPMTWALRQFISLWFGLLMVLLAFWVDLRSRHSLDYAFWLYLFGVLTFWGGLTLMNSDSEWGKLGYFAINLAMLGVGAMLGRRVFAVFGGLGAAGYLGHLAHSVFKDSLLFPFALTAIGLGVIGLGILWQRHEARLATRLRVLLPRPLRELVERRQPPG
jgi:hypothetical protein